MPEKEIRTILAPTSNSYVLLPNSAVAEVLSFTTPEPFKKAPSWLLGELAWHGWQVPVICMDQLALGRMRDAISPQTRILIIKTLGESTQVNYIGLLVHGLPRLKKINAKTLIEKPSEQLPKTLFSKVMIDDLEAVIPELSTITQVVEEAAYGNS